MTLSEIWQKSQRPITDPNPIDSRIEISVDGIKLNGKQYTFDEFNSIADKVMTEYKRIEKVLDYIERIKLNNEEFLKLIGVEDLTLIQSILKGEDV